MRKMGSTLGEAVALSQGTPGAISKELQGSQACLAGIQQNQARDPAEYLSLLSATCLCPLPVWTLDGVGESFPTEREQYGEIAITTLGFQNISVNYEWVQGHGSQTKARILRLELRMDWFTLLVVADIRHPEVSGS